ncbi:Glutamyl aminopeptidase [Frankliniella fusca]|uniref:glutamyl aminopeptidase n=1 Tax=Frankliniella fusca TaxID=407009 RepID=A0AAE1HXL8_9NEOP|nr:Glutamyl aminopeptidase [Frankliniella fusca]
MKGAGAPEQPDWETQNRLPSTVVPSRYDILLHPDLDSKADTFGNFTGTVQIQIEFREDRTWFVIHAKYLDFTKVNLKSDAGAVVELQAPLEIPKNEWWVIQPTSGNITSGTYTLTLDFKGRLDRSIVGFYRSVHKNENGENSGAPSCSAPPAGSGSGRGAKRSLVTPCLVGLCAVLGVAAACLLVTLLLLQHTFRMSPESPRPAEPELEGQLRALERLEHHEQWALERVRDGLNVSGASLDEMVAWLLRHGERLQAARIILEEHRKASAPATTATLAPAVTTPATPAAPSAATAATPAVPEAAPTTTLRERPDDAEPLEETETIAASDFDERQRQLEAAVAVSEKKGDPHEAWNWRRRLPEDVLPERYDLQLHPHLRTGALSGRVSITLRVTAPRRDLWLHADGMHIKEVELALVKADDDASASTSGGEEGWCAREPGGLKVEDTFLVSQTQFLVVRVDCQLLPGVYDLHVVFSGSLLAEGRGMFRSAYATSSNETRYIATTKFEPTYARLAFPCFDEPAMKASYKVRLVKPSSSEYIALSNSDVKSVTPISGTELTTVEFTETVKMSSYLAAFIVCDFERQKENTTMASGKPVNIYARKEQIANTAEALKVAQNVVDFYASYFGIPYPMPKVDLIAIPDFVSGAMENWGLITFRETSVLFDPNENSPANRESISETVAHELAHMWFGNLVTMKWWTDLWLNEGFATFMAQKSVANMHPDWAYGDQFVVDTLLSVLKLDAELSSHPVLQEVSNPDQITEIFDSISYDKGSSVILMLEAFMGPENFKKGLHTYLSTHQYSNAETADLWRALQDYATSGVDVAKVMDTWTRQMGFPLVTVKKTEQGKYVVSQKRFLSNKEAKFDPSTSKYGYKWEIPISYLYSTSSLKGSSSIWLSSKDNVELPIGGDIKLLKLNHNQRGYYRVNYDAEGWNALISSLSTNPEAMDAVDRAGLISDAFSLADAEELQYETALELTKYLKMEKDFVPWSAASTAISSLLERLPNSENLKKYGNAVINSVVNEVSWTVSQDDNHLTRRLRALVLGLSCSLKNVDSLNQANSMFKDWLKGGQKPHPDIRSVVYRYGLGNSNDENDWNLLLEKFEKETNTQEKVKLMFALATTPDKSLLNKYLELAKDESVIRSQDYFTVLSYIAENPNGIDLVWNFYREQYEYLVNRFTLNDRVFGRFISRIATKFDTTDRLNEMEAFFKKYPEAGAGTAARKQAIEGVTNRIKWLDTHRTTVEDWFSKNV